MPETAKYPSVRVFLRLLGEKHPVKNLLTLMNENLPVLPSYQNESQVQGALKPVYKQAPSTNRTQFPPLVSARPPGIRSPINMSKVNRRAKNIFLCFASIGRKNFNDEEKKKHHTFTIREIQRRKEQFSLVTNESD